MFNKLIFFYLAIIFLNLKPLLADSYIVAKVNNEIITNNDIAKEINYLEILNPNINSLREDQKFNLSKRSLIDEIIKKKEIQKFIKDDAKSLMLDKYIEDFYKKLGYLTLENFEQDLIIKNNYSLNEIKKKFNIELLWNELIFSKFKNQIKINENQLLEKLDLVDNVDEINYNISEIVFNKDKDKPLDNLINEIELSISEIGFGNTATLFSISESAKFGGKIGWINKSSLSNKILAELEKIEIGDKTNVIQIGNRYIILKINELEKIKQNVDKDKELNKLIQLETNKQLNRFSKIYFDKTKINYQISE